MPARHKARKRALDALYEADLRGTDAREVLARQAVVNVYTIALVDGVIAAQPHLDGLIDAAAQDWSLDRMPTVDRNLLRIGAWEVLYSEDVPDDVAISEAVTLAGELSTDESAGFVNGVLAQIARRTTPN